MTSLNPQQPVGTGVPDPLAVHRPAGDTEEIYYEGHPLMRGALGKGFLWVFVGLLLIALAIVAAVLKWRFPWWVSLGLVIVGLIVMIVPVLRSKTVRYKVSNYRIDYERGVLSKNIATIELWHVEDINFHQTLIDRILGVGNITVESHDRTMPLLVMHDVPQARQLFEQLKQRIIAVKRQQGVIKVDSGQ